MKTNAFAAVLLAGYAFGLPLDAAALTVTRGPYLQLGTESSIVVRWRTDTATNSRVRYGTNPSKLSRVVDDATSATEHVVKLTGLNPSTKYYYSVGHSAATLAGDTNHFFVTAPTAGTEQPTHIWVLGNSGTANAKARAVRDAYLKYKGNQYTHLWLMLGDNAYQNGTDSDYQNAVFNAYPTLLRQTTLWPTLGHRDGFTADSASQSGAYYDIFTLPKQGEAGGLASGTEAYYSFDYGNIHFVVLDSVESNKAPTGAMLTWLKNDLAATTQAWIIAYWHHPPYSKGFHDSDTEAALREMRENVLPILEDAAVDLVLSGHSGSYERSFLIDGHYGKSGTFDPRAMLVDGGDGRIDGDGAYQKLVTDKPIRGTIYTVVGSSGETRRGSLDHPVMNVSLNTLGSMVLNVNGPLLDATFLDDTGRVRDRFRMVKTTDTAKASSSAAEVPTTEVSPAAQTDPIAPETVSDAAGNVSSDSSIARATTQAASSTSNLVAHWTLDTQNVDTAQSSAEVRDVSGYNNHADLKNHSATTVPGKLGQALSLDGVDDYAKKISFSGLPSSAITVSAWIKLDAHKNWNRVLNHEWVNNGWLLFTDASGTAIFGVGQSEAQYNAIKAGLAVGSWYHLVGVYDGANVRIYVNGQEGTSQAKSGVVLDSAGNVDIGGSERDRFKGAIDDVRIYNKALTASEVAALYNVGGTSNLVAHWTLDTQNVDTAQSGAEVRDVSGYNNHADLKNHSATTVPGKLGQALSLDGVDDYAEKISFSGLPSSAITVSAWIKLDAHKNWNRVLNHEWVNNGWLLFTDASGTAIFGVGQSGAQYNAIKAGLAVGSWYHLVGVYDGLNVRVYVNGQEGTPWAKSGVVLDSAGNVDIGGAERDRFKGAIDDVRIYNKALTASEVAALSNVGGTTDTAAPSPPTNLSASAVSSSQINLSWNASTDNVGVTGYKVYRAGAQIATTTGTSYSNTGLSPSITYSYTVAAYDAAGNTSAKSTSVSVTTQQATPDTTAPSTPTGLTASAVSSSQINLAWTFSTDNVGVTGYKVYRGGTQITTVTGTSYQNTGLAPSTTYTYTVAAYDAAGNTSAQASSASATTQAQGGIPPTSLSITSYGATGNDTTDDTTAINNTINAAKAQGKRAYIPPGSFYHKGFTLDGVSMTGAGNTTSVLYTPVPSTAVVVRGSGVTISNLQLKAATTERDPAGSHLVIDAASNFTIDSIIVDGSNGSLIHNDGGSFGKIINNTVRNSLADSIHNTGGAHDMIIANNTVRNGTDDLIAMVSYGQPAVRNFLVQNNDVSGNAAGRGITSVGSSDITIQGNKISNTTCCAGILVATEPAWTSPPLSNILIRNNQLSNNGGYSGHGAFLISGLNGNINKVRFEGNTITNPVDDSIKLEGDNSIIALINNTMSDPEGRGITIVSGSNVYCSGNTLNDSANSPSKCTGANNFTVTGSSLTY